MAISASQQIMLNAFKNRNSASAKRRVNEKRGISGSNQIDPGPSQTSPSSPISVGDRKAQALKRRQEIELGKTGTSSMSDRKQQAILNRQKIEESKNQRVTSVSNDRKEKALARREEISQIRAGQTPAPQTGTTTQNLGGTPPVDTGFTGSQVSPVDLQFENESVQTASDQISQLQARRDDFMSNVNSAKDNLQNVRQNEFERLFGQESDIVKLFQPSVLEAQERVLKIDDQLAFLKEDIVEANRGKVDLTTGQLGRITGARDRELQQERRLSQIDLSQRLSEMNFAIGMADREFSEVVAAAQSEVEQAIFTMEQSGLFDENQIEIIQTSMMNDLNKQIADREFERELFMMASESGFSGVTPVRPDRVTFENTLRETFQGLANVGADTSEFKSLMIEAQQAYDQGVPIPQIQLGMLDAIQGDSERAIINSNFANLSSSSGAVDLSPDIQNLIATSENQQDLDRKLNAIGASENLKRQATFAFNNKEASKILSPEEESRVAGLTTIHPLWQGSRTSDKDMKIIRDDIVRGINNGLSDDEILVGQLTDKGKEFSPVALNLLLKATALDDFNIKKMITLPINAGDPGQAVANVENALLETVDNKLNDTVLANSTIRKIEEAQRIADTVSPDFVGKFDEVKLNFVASIPEGASDEEVQSATRLNSLLSDIAKDIRLKYAGSNVTENEIKFLSAFLTDVSDQPEILDIKLDRMKESILTEYNSARSQKGLPEVSAALLGDADDRVRLYMPSILSTGGSAGVPGGQGKDFKDAIDDFLEGFNAGFIQDATNLFLQDLNY